LIVFKNIYRHKGIQWSIKLLILVLLLWFSYQQIFERADFSELTTTLTEALSPSFFALLFLVSLLMLLNWSLEAEKWRRLMLKIEALSFPKALASIFAGTSLAIFTPNRVGEYGGRLWLLEKADPGETIAVTILGSISQLLITFLMGGLSLIVYLGFIESYLDISVWLVLAFFIPVAIGSIHLYLNPKKVLNILPNRSFLKLFREKAEIIQSYDNQDLIRTLSYSFIRYLVFTAQYLIFLLMFGVDINYLSLILLISRPSFRHSQ